MNNKKMETMIDIFHTVFEESNYNLLDTFDNIYFYKNKLWDEYFLLSVVNDKEIINYLQNEHSHFQKVLQFFESKKKDNSTIEKNTSYILAIELQQLNQKNIDSIKNSILEIEEDKYWFKKYSLIFDKKSLEWFKENIPTVNLINLRKKINDQVLFLEFKNDNFTSSGYHLLMQLFIKLPFLHLERDQNRFNNLTSIINKKLSSDDLIIKDKIMTLDIEKLELMEGKVLEISQYDIPNITIEKD